MNSLKSSSQIQTWCVYHGSLKFFAVIDIINSVRAALVQVIEVVRLRQSKAVCTTHMSHQKYMATEVTSVFSMQPSLNILCTSTAWMGRLTDHLWSSGLKQLIEDMKASFTGVLTDDPRLRTHHNSITRPVNHSPGF